MYTTDGDLVSTGSFTIGPSTTTSDISFTDINNDWISVSDIDSRLERIEARLLILPEPAADLMAEYPALKSAYEHYKTVEALVNGDS